MSEAKTNAPAIFFPKDFYCPITLELFKKPYIGPSNLTFEYDALVSHFAVSDIHPITRVKCSLADFGPNISLRNSIESMQQEYAKQNIAVSTKLPMVEKEAESITFTKGIAHRSWSGTTGVITLTNKTVEQPGSDITVIIDHSGSMGESAALKGEDGKKSENGLTLQDVTNASAVAVLESLNETDRISVIKYNANVTVVAPLTFATNSFKKEMSENIKAIRSGGQTNIWGALREALEQYRANSVPGRKQTIMLLTDGRPNICPTRGEKHALSSWFEEYPDTNIDIHTVGFGNSIDSHLLYDIATVGRGSYNFLPSPDMIGTIFVNLAANCLSASCMMPTVDIWLTKDYKFAVEPIPGMTNQVTRLTDNHIRVKCPRLKCNSQFSLAFELDKDDKGLTLDDITVDGGPSMKSVRWQTQHPPISSHIARNAVIKGIDKINNLLSIGDSVDDVYEDTLQVLNQVPSAKSLVEDWTNQVREAANLSSHPNGQYFWQTWGKHWLRSLKMAHLYQYTNNFRDPGIQSYAKKCTLFEVLQEKITKIFDGLPPPEPSKYVEPENRCRSMAAYNNIAYDGCFDGDCSVRTPGPTMPKVCEDSRLIKVKDLKKGDLVYTSENDCDMVECVVRTKCTSEENGQPYATYSKLESGLLVTQWHPIQVADPNDFRTIWEFPANLTKSVVNKPCEYVYDVVLKERTPTLMVNDVMVATLGHGLRGEVIGHEYFGDRIIDDLKKLEGYDQGLVTTNGFKRNADSGLIDGLID